MENKVFYRKLKKMVDEDYIVDKSIINSYRGTITIIPRQDMSFSSSLDVLERFFYCDDKYFYITIDKDDRRFIISKFEHFNTNIERIVLKEK